MIKISAPNRLRIAAIERLIGGWGPSCVVDDVSPHHRQTQSLGGEFRTTRRNQCKGELNHTKLVLRRHSGGVEHGFARFANRTPRSAGLRRGRQAGSARQAADRTTRVALTDRSLTCPWVFEIVVGGCSA